MKHQKEVLKQSIYSKILLFITTFNHGKKNEIIH
jgi:hypothetical protein